MLSPVDHHVLSQFLGYFQCVCSDIRTICLAWDEWRLPIQLYVLFEALRTCPILARFCESAVCCLHDALLFSMSKKW